MIPKIKGLIVLLIMLFFVQGCWGARETDEMGYVLLMGIDKGEKNIVKVTYQIAVPQPLEGGGDKKPTEIFEVEAASILGAQQLVSTFASKDLTLIHNKVLAVSEEIAQEGLGRYIHPSIRSRDLRRTTFLFVVKGKASEFINNNQELIFDKYPSKEMELYMSGANTTGLLVNSDIQSFYNGLNSPGVQPTAVLVAVKKEEEAQETEKEEEEFTGYRDKVINEMAYLPGEIPRKGGNKFEIIGQAVFKEDKLAGFLNGKETRYYQMLSGDFHRGVFSILDPKKPEDHLVVLEIIQRRPPKIRVKAEEIKTVIEVDLLLKGEILSIQSGLNYESGELQMELENYISTFLTQEVTRLIKKTQEEFSSDIFGFGEYTRGFFWTWDEWVNYNWHDKYPNCEVKVHTNFSIRRSGMMLKTTHKHN